MTLSDLLRALNLLEAPASTPGRSRLRGRLPRLILMTDPRRTPDPVAAAANLPRGAIVILRHYGDRRRWELARALVRFGRPRGIRIVIAGDPRLALRVGADGVHLPEFMARRGFPSWALWRRPGWIVTAAAHSWAAVVRAKRAFADAVLLSPVFPTESRPDAPLLGPIAFARLSRRSPLPVYALGGITPARARRLAGCRAAGIAGIRGLAAGVREIAN